MRCWLFIVAMFSLAAAETVLRIDREFSRPNLEVHYQVRVNDDLSPIIDTLYLTPVKESPQ